MNPVAFAAYRACISEVTARKPGNVNRICDFPDLTLMDFLLSAGAIAPILGNASSQPLGTTILEAVRATRAVVNTNTNLGIILLLAPLAAVPMHLRLIDGIRGVIGATTVADCTQVYEAIRLATPGGLAKVDSQDVADQPTVTLQQAMTLAASYDRIGKQYAEGFSEIFQIGVPALVRAWEQCGDLESAILGCHLVWLATGGDSLIARKRGIAESQQSQLLAGKVLAGEWTIDQFDAWLRAQGTGRNPGTTADLVTASLFAAFRDGHLPSGPICWSKSPLQTTS
ncbi:triphosphoribosyl-dephospho-CoA synthase [Tuwongella immobilis]|uniref:Uncharacterized protein n=1 Tax=Tuwongella immobilis TaxID=692036 RepID=A0A6C2YPP6_9BACT|nr:triphosphoribosyl-dephospho-CoA synthase [Tuwongella immobilis]VIP03374.1 triphosphoribosyl-dephospho- protein : Triphosphoribosyl-dephospho-CoA synthase OS=Planctomyces maris DSM 8797 GN=PM8797T_18204 PE=4 SV=1: CitG [Tuwongella immobilis]VTS04120.1 triphosphoribosyl-dephospho- protein : Triphosphoribosyl-dephospho-CoA synthase OS=Planctomyces maris DSM 8797 GN=PM8797T_18204 PE=4 SV=1: CitG [Tuwongella immobilis]